MVWFSITNHSDTVLSPATQLHVYIKIFFMNMTPLLHLKLCAA